MRRIYEHARRFKPFPRLVAFLCYFLLLLEESNIKNMVGNGQNDFSKPMSILGQAQPALLEESNIKH